MINRRIWRVWLAAMLSASLLGATGCSAYRDPRITMDRVTMLERSAEALSAHVVLDLTNPNQEALELLEVDYIVRVNGAKVGSLRRAAQATLAGNGVRQIEIPIVLRFDQLGWSADSLPERAEFSVKGNLQYVTPGEIAQILFDTGVRKPRADFKAQGTIALH